MSNEIKRAERVDKAKKRGEKFKKTMKRVGATLFSLTDDILYIAGVAAVTYGFYLICPPLGWICGGAGAIAYAVMWAKCRK